MRGLLRYLLLAAVLVVGAVSAFAGWYLTRPQKPLVVKSTAATMAPRPGARGGPVGIARGGFLADAPWALSTLPDCLQQVSVTRGTRAFVLAAIPADALPVRPPARLVYGDCRIALGASGAIVRRGPDTLRVPPPLRLFRSASRLYVLHLEGPGAQLRAYVPSNP